MKKTIKIIAIIVVVFLALLIILPDHGASAVRTFNLHAWLSWLMRQHISTFRANAFSAGAEASSAAA